MAARRRFGYLRKLPSGRWQASYLDPESIRRTGPETFSTKREAEQWLAFTETELLRGEWRNPDDQRVTLSEFGNRWIKERPGLRPRTVDLYEWLFGKYVQPHLGSVALGDLDAARVRSWRAKLLDEGTSEIQTAKAYRLLRAILMTAVDDGIISRNPCRIRGAGAEPTYERSALTVPQVFKLAEAVPPRYLSWFSWQRLGVSDGVKQRRCVGGTCRSVPGSFVWSAHTWSGQTVSWSSARPSPAPG